MLKTIACFIILATTTCGGFVFAEAFKKRTKQLTELQMALHHLSNEIEFTHTPLPVAFNNIALKSEEPVRSVLIKVSELLIENTVENVYEAFSISLKAYKNKIELKKEDEAVLLDFAKGLGESDLQGQKKLFALAMENLKKQISMADLSMNKNVKMYRYLGFSLGAMIVILLI